MKREVQVYNGTGEDVPVGSAVIISEWDTERNVYQIQKPTTNNDVRARPAASFMSKYDGHADVDDYQELEGVSVTVTVDGTDTVLTEGDDWTASGSNQATATSLASALNGVTGLVASAVDIGEGIWRAAILEGEATEPFTNIVTSAALGLTVAAGTIYGFAQLFGDMRCATSEPVSNDDVIGCTANAWTWKADSSGTLRVFGRETDSMARAVLEGGAGSTAFFPVKILGSHTDRDSEHSWLELSPTAGGGWEEKSGGRRGVYDTTTKGYEATARKDIPPTTFAFMQQGSDHAFFNLNFGLAEYPFDMIDRSETEEALTDEWNIENQRDTEYDITAFADAGGGKVRVAAPGNSFSNDDWIGIASTTHYDGGYTVSNVGGGTFDITHTWEGDDAEGVAFKAYQGLEISVVTRMAYDHTGTETLYAYYRTFTWDSNGKLVSVSAETRVVIDVPDEC